MIGELFSLAFYSTIGGGTFGNLLFQWEQAGVFSYVLPFLFITLVVFGILSIAHPFGQNKAINVLLALITGLLALQFNFVSILFSEIFPKLGIIVIIIFIVFIGLGLFLKKDSNGNLPKWFRNTMMVVIGAIIVWAVVTSLGNFGWYIGYGWWFGLQHWLPTIIITALVIGLLIWAFSSTGKPPKGKVSP